MHFRTAVHETGGGWGKNMETFFQHHDSLFSNFSFATSFPSLSTEVFKHSSVQQRLRHADAEIPRIVKTIHLLN
jgi:hypothetical protein